MSITTFHFTMKMSADNRQNMQWIIARKEITFCLRGRQMILIPCLFLKGQKEVLQPYIDRGDIKIVSGKTPGYLEFN